MRALLAILVATTFAIKVPLLASVALQTRDNETLLQVFNLLTDLRRLNDEEQSQADARNVAEEAECASTIAALQQSLEQATQEWTEAKNHLKFVQDELKTTRDHIADLSQRYDRNLKRLEELSEHRCSQNAQFVQSLRQHKEALAALEILRAELANYFATGAGNVVALFQNSPAYAMCKNNPNCRASANFRFLEYGEDFYGVSYDSNAASEHRDNNVEGLKNLDDSSYVGQRPNFEGDTEASLYGLIDQLEDHLAQSLEDLENAEIKSAYDFADWQDATEKENGEIQAELARKTTYEAKLVEGLKVAESYESKTHAAYDNAVASLEAKQAECEHKKDYYQSENVRRAEENEVIDATLEIGRKILPNLDEYTKTRLGGVEKASTPTRRIYDFSLDRSDFEETGGYVAGY
jgi:hypothetical protein